MEKISFTIPVTPRTKKNSSSIRYKNGHPYITPSEAYKDFQSKCAWLIPAKYRNLKINKPVNVKAVYFVDCKRRIDKTNLESALMDVLVYVGVISDDSAINPEIVVSTDGSRVFVDRKNPRIEVEIEEVDYGC